MENLDLAILWKATTDLSERKTEYALVRTYLKYQTSDQFCYVCENGYHKASDCELLVNKVINDKSQIEKLCSKCNYPELKECVCDTETVNTPIPLVNKG